MTHSASNPLLAGDWPDPSVLRVGGDYYLTHSSFRYAPGLLIWHSRDLLTWRPLCHALSMYDGDVWAPELCYHDGRFFIYYKTTGGNHVLHADAITGPWQRPVDLGVGYIDPGHVVGPDGRRYLHLSNGQMVELAADGLSVLSKPSKVYEGWPIPDSWRTEGMCLEGPKLIEHGGYYHMLSAEGGTAGPATSHMVIHARSRSPIGPWENSPHNPIIHTPDATRRWHSRGHGTLVQAPDASWWIIYHAYEKNFQTLGRQTLIEPVAWTGDGWLLSTDTQHAEGALPFAPRAVTDKLSLDDSFAGPELSWQWRFYDQLNRSRYRFDQGLILTAQGDAPGNSSPLACIPMHRGYEVEMSVELLSPAATAGLMLFYGPSAFAGLGVSAAGVIACNNHWGIARLEEAPTAGHVRLRIINDHHSVALAWCIGGDEDGEAHWRQPNCWSDMSGYHHNVFGGFMGLRIALFASGEGAARFRHFRYRPQADL